MDMVRFDMKQPTIKQRRLNLLYGSWLDEARRLSNSGRTYRQIVERFASDGVPISISTLSVWFRQASRPPEHSP